MATPREQFIALRNSGVSAVEARKQTIDKVAPPITPVSTVPISPTTSINQAKLAENKASRQANPVAPVAQAPVAPVPLVQAPVDPTTGLSKPLESTAPIAPTNTGIATTQVTPKADPTP